MPGALGTGKAAMLLDGSWDVGAAVTASKGKYQFGYFPVPGSNDPADNKSVLAVGETFNVVKGAPNTDAAMKWLAFFSSSKEYAKWIVSTGASSDEVGSDNFPGITAKTMGEWFGKGWISSLIEPAFPATGAFYDQSANWPTLLLDVAQGSKSPQSAAKTIQAGWP
jgi:ABC-type glycerol-3-phosphate transport system substrate-binding protein